MSTCVEVNSMVLRISARSKMTSPLAYGHALSDFDLYLGAALDFLKLA
jgi:hypothetical protein